MPLPRQVRGSHANSINPCVTPQSTFFVEFFIFATEKKTVAPSRLYGAYPVFDVVIGVFRNELNTRGFCYIMVYKVGDTK